MDLEEIQEMLKQKSKQKIYCYVDETGQDVGSTFFVVVNILSNEDQNAIRKKLEQIESETGVLFKWQKTELTKNENFLRIILQRKICQGGVYFIRVQKPILYLAPVIRILEKAILDKARGYYKTTIYIDGIDKKKASEITNTLRGFGIHTNPVRSARDESEPLIRLADRWAGCIRKAYEGRKKEKKIFKRAKEQEYLKQIK